MARRSMLGRLVGAVLALTVASSVCTVSTAEAATTQKACCAKMHHDCGGAAITQKCCAPDGSTTAALAPDTSSSRPWHRALPGLARTSSDPGLSTLGSFAATGSSLPRLPRAPTYLSASVIRI